MNTTVLPPSSDPRLAPVLLGRRRFLRLGATGVAVASTGALLAACGSDSATSESDTTESSSAPEASTAAADDTTGDTAAAPEETTTIDVAMGWINNVEYGGSWIAIDQGFYAAEGIEPNYLAGGPNAPLPPVAVAAGDAKIGITPNMQSLLDAINEGNDFVVFAAQYQASPGAVLSLAANPVEQPDDLVGIKFLGQEGVNEQIDAVLTIAGLDKDYEFIVAGFTPDPLLEGQGDAYSCFAVNQPITLEQQGLVEGEDFIVTPWADLGIPSYSNLFFAERSYLEENRDAIVRFMRATIKGWEQNAIDPAVAAGLAVDDFGADLGLDLAQQTRQNELQLRYMTNELTESTGLMRIDPAEWDGAMTTAYLAAGRDAMPSSTDVLDLTILDDVYGDATTLLDS